jgi:chemotaxis family two-component system sensor kinase Cph1
VLTPRDDPPAASPVTGHAAPVGQSCADEPIRIPGAIQPHGTLLALSLAERRVITSSAHAPVLFGREVLGENIGELLAAEDATQLPWQDPPGAPSRSFRVAVRGIAVDLVVHRVEQLLITEWEPTAEAQSVGPAWHARLPQVLGRMTVARTVLELAASLVVDVRDLTGFDRVMLYRFDEQWNGEVIAEDRREDLAPYLGLHYPATDIPAQARALYEQNWLRLIPDTDYTPVPLISDREPENGRSLDLSGSVLRSVSPVHLRYLANMGVRASMSVSLLKEGRLWGLIACHHLSGAHRPSYQDRVVAEFLGRTASVLLASKTTAHDSDKVLAVARHQALILDALSRAARTPLVALAADDTSALGLVPSAGAAVKLDGRLLLLGSTPTPERIDELIPQLLTAGTTHTQALSRDVPSAHDLTGVASGVLVVPVGIGGDFVAWFRPEVLTEVRWAGDPTEAKQTSGSGRLGPRTSFAEWKQTVRATSAPWLDHEIAAAHQLQQHLHHAALVRAQDDNRFAVTLQRTLLLEDLPHIPGVALAARYLPAGRDVVGGDWYDLILLPSGSVALVLGDVAGHGLQAAAITAQLRHGLRAYLLRETGPAAALTALNQLVAALLPTEFATAVVAELDPVTGSLTVASAGHLPPLLITPDGSSLLEIVSGPGLGLSRLALYEQDTVTLAEHDRLVLYSDGLVERRGTDLKQDLARLLLAGRSLRGDPDGVLDALLLHLAPADDDDVTLLAVGLRG